jgi:hypothetical protein
MHIGLSIVTPQMLDYSGQNQIARCEVHTRSSDNSQDSRFIFF